MRKIIIILIIFVLAGCGKRVYVDYLPEPSMPAKNKKFSKVLIFPFSSYSLAKNPRLWMNANIILFNAITDNLAKHNILPIPYEDIFTVLKRNGFIKSSSFHISSDLQREYMDANWSPTMKKEISKIIIEEKMHAKQKSLDSLETILYMTENEMFHFSDIYQSDYVICGTITELNVQKEDTFDPFKIGLFNAPMKFFSRTLFGVGESEGWARGQQVYTGALIGGILGSFANEPFEPPSHTYKGGHPLLGNTIRKKTGGNYDFELGNALFWGALTGFTAFIGSHGSDSPVVNVGLRIYIYNSKTKELIWTNRVKLHVTPETMWGEQNIKKLLSFAIKQSVDKLLNGFWKFKYLEIANKS